MARAIIPRITLPDVPEIRNEPDCAKTEAARFLEAIEGATARKEEFVDPRLAFYPKMTAWPRNVFRIAGMRMIVCSALLPAFAAFRHDLAVTILSVTAAILSSPAAFFRSEVAWRVRLMADLAIKQYCAKWKLELARARLSMKSEEIRFWTETIEQLPGYGNFAHSRPTRSAGG